MFCAISTGCSNMWWYADALFWFHTIILNQTNPLRSWKPKWQEDPTLAIFEDVDGGFDHVCRGSHPGLSPLRWAKIQINLTRIVADPKAMLQAAWWVVAIDVPRRQFVVLLYSQHSGVQGGPQLRMLPTSMCNRHRMATDPQDCQRQCSMATGHCTGEHPLVVLHLSFVLRGGHLSCSRSIGWSPRQDLNSTEAAAVSFGLSLPDAQFNRSNL